VLGRVFLRAIADLARAEPEIFSLGFAWGGLGDFGAVPNDGADRRGFGGQKMLAYTGHARHWKRLTPPIDSPTA